MNLYGDFFLFPNLGLKTLKTVKVLGFFMDTLYALLFKSQELWDYCTCWDFFVNNFGLSYGTY